MRTATIEEASCRLRELIEAARAGERVEIVDAEGPIATIVATRGQGSHRRPSPETVALVRRLQALGLVSGEPPSPDPDAIDDLPDGDTGVLRALLEERADGR